MGYTFKKAKLDFEECFNEEEYFEYYDGEKPDNVNFDFFCSILKYIINNEIYEWDFDELGYIPIDDIEYSDLLKYMFDTIVDFEGWLLGFPFSNPLFVFRVAIDLIGYEGDVVYDLSDVISSGYYEAGYQFADKAKQSFEREHNIFGSTIIITEGKTDRELSGSGLKS